MGFRVQGSGVSVPRRHSWGCMEYCLDPFGSLDPGLELDVEARRDLGFRA